MPTVSRVIDIDKGWKTFKVRTRNAGKLALKVGVIDDKENFRTGVPVSEYAAAVELGVPGKIPERPFMRRAIDENTGKIFEMMRGVVIGLQDGNINARQGYRTIALRVREMIIESIASAQQWAIPLAEFTVLEKGHEVPLLDSGTLLSSIKHKIVPAGQRD